MLDECAPGLPAADGRRAAAVHPRHSRGRGPQPARSRHVERAPRRRSRPIGRDLVQTGQLEGAGSRRRAEVERRQLAGLAPRPPGAVGWPSERRPGQGRPRGARRRGPRRGTEPRAARATVRSRQRPNEPSRALQTDGVPAAQSGRLRRRSASRVAGKDFTFGPPTGYSAWVSAGAFKHRLGWSPFPSRPKTPDEGRRAWPTAAPGPLSATRTNNRANPHGSQGNAVVWAITPVRVE